MITDYFIEPGDYLKIDNVTLGFPGGPEQAGSALRTIPGRIGPGSCESAGTEGAQTEKWTKQRQETENK